MHTSCYCVLGLLCVTSIAIQACAEDLENTQILEPRCFWDTTRTEPLGCGLILHTPSPKLFFPSPKVLMTHGEEKSFTYGSTSEAAFEINKEKKVYD